MECDTRQRGASLRRGSGSNPGQAPTFDSLALHQLYRGDDAIEA